MRGRKGTYTVPAPQVNPTIPRYVGRSTGDVSMERMVMTPRYMPAPPRPQMARPTMRAFMLGAAPQTADPTSKRAVVPI